MNYKLSCKILPVVNSSKKITTNVVVNNPNSTGELKYQLAYYNMETDDNHVATDLYVVSNEKPDVGDYIIENDKSKLSFYKVLDYDNYNIKLYSYSNLNEYNISNNYILKNFKRIEATTDDSFPELKRIPISLVKEFCYSNGELISVDIDFNITSACICDTAEKSYNCPNSFGENCLKRFKNGEFWKKIPKLKDNEIIPYHKLNDTETIAKYMENYVSYISEHTDGIVKMSALEFIDYTLKI